MDFLQLSGKTILIVGVANRKSVAWHTAKVLQENGAKLIFSVRSEARAESVRKLFPDSSVFVCDVEHQDQIDSLKASVATTTPVLHGIVHSVAFADYSAGWLPFHQTPRPAFLQAINISCYSLIALSEAFRDSQNYGYMAPVKAALDSSLCFLAKSFSQFSRVRFNAVCPGLLKTSASAGIPGYVDSYLFAEKATLRKQAVQTEEVASAVAFLLSPRSSGINAQGLVIDAGMGVNYFDKALVSP
jgi:enoyl-[acyl-carrier protein] reductase I